ncbi:MAG: ABC transporter ATP-binding protein [Chloroflexi bacterium]|nr:ABC transporter ATP-binding protein [Chloroflexota bacterium]
MAVLRRMSKYLRPYYRLLAFLLLCMFAGLAGDVFGPRLLTFVIDRGIMLRSMPNVLKYSALLVVIALVRAALRYGQMLSQERLGQETVRQLRHDLYVRLQRLSFSFYTANNTGDLMSRLTNDVSAIMDFFGFGIAEMVSASLMFTFTLIMLLVLDWRLTLVVCVPIPFLIFFAFRFSGIVGPAWEKIRVQMGKLSTTLQENVSGVRVVKSYGREHHEIDKFSARNESTLKANVDRADIEARTFPLMSLITGMCFLLLYWYGGRRVIDGQLSLGTFFSFNWYIWSLIWPIRFLGFLISIAQKAIASGPRVFEILDSPLEIPDTAPEREMSPIKGLVRFEDVHFAFTDKTVTPVLQGLDLEIQPGQVVAVLGGTGSGKSSLINLIPRFYDPQQGCITIDGIDLRDVSLASLRRQIGIVPQETYLFSDTVRNNIAFGRPDTSDEVILEAAEAAQAAEFIRELPNGLDTRVGERGLGLSGGQKQRIAIARALVTDPRILILDEATSSVDAETEYLLQVALDRVMRNRTCIVIAQRLSTVQNADQVLVLKDGRVAERGTHAELLALGGEYTRIYNLQLKAQETLLEDECPATGGATA